MTPKKRTKKTNPSDKGSERRQLENFEIEEPLTHEELPQGRTLPRGSKYDELYRRALKLKPGQVLPIRLSPEDGPYQRQKSSLHQAIRRVAQEFSDHYVSLQDTAEDWIVGIYCYEAEWDGDKKRRRTRTRKKARKKR